VPSDCPVHQQSNDYLRATVDSDGWTMQHSNAAEVIAEGQRGTGLSGAAPDCPVRHRTIRCRMRTKPPTVDQLQALTTGWCGGTPDTVRWRTGHCPVRPSQAAFSNGYNLVGGYKYHPNGHFKVWEPKQHSKSYSWHIQALPTTSIHWSILYTRFRPLQPTQVPQKREQAKDSFSCEFSNNSLWESLR
jgi:hypothetical protein